MGVEKYLVLVCGSKLAWFLCGDIEIDLVLECGSKCIYLSSKLDFCVRDRISLGFSIGIERYLCFVRGIEIDRVRAEMSLF